MSVRSCIHNMIHKESENFNKGDYDVVISCRLRIARNLAEFPFPNKLNSESSKSLIDKVKNSFFSGNELMKNEFNFINIESIEDLEKQILFEKNLISVDLVKNRRPRAVIISKDESISIMINEEDHLRIQCLDSKMNLENSFEICKKIDILLEEKIDFAFDKKYGYLTSCPTNIGTGIRASVMLHLPALTMTGYINEILQNVTKLGMTVRGTHGENSSSTGNFFQISNQKTLGQTEASIIENVNNITYHIIDQERNLREELYTRNKIRFEDKIFRSLGTLTNARLLSTEECLKLISDVRLGIDMGIINYITKSVIDDVMLKIQPGFLQKSIDKIISPNERDIIRANVVRKMFSVT